jgi:hypothetical protein
MKAKRAGLKGWIEMAGAWESLARLTHYASGIRQRPEMRQSSCLPLRMSLLLLGVNFRWPVSGTKQSKSTGRRAAKIENLDPE